jgi:hypothetical protein
MVMRVVAISAARMVLRDRDLDIVALPRLHRPEDIVGVSTRADVATVEVKVCGVEMVWQ